MKKGTVTGIVLAVAAIIALGALAAYLTLQYKEDAFSSGTTAESEADAFLQALHQTEAESDPAKAASKDASAGSSAESPFIVWVGDSRTIGMRDAMKNDDLYIGASGEGYDWLSETGLPQVKEAIADYPGAPVVFNFGVNDYDNMDNYLVLYESLLEEYPDTHFYFLSVNPIDPAVCKNITNEEITDFNNHLKQTFSDTYIDSYTFLRANDAVTIDGIHYSEEDYRAIHDFAAKEVQKAESKISS
ncbi:MAG: hypothetical protein Q4C61_04805 [Lachnospiraceae bacterium]|nr:hypothetical protein [Lachnospiraceae bacterium]